MYELSLAKHPKLRYHETHHRIFFNIFTKLFYERNYHQTHIAPEVQEWLIETIGYDFQTFRELDRVFHTRSPMNELNELKLTYKNYDKHNPMVPDEKRTWEFNSHRGCLVFRDEAHAALFKLRWF